MNAELWKDEPRWLRICADPRIIAVSCAWLIVLTVLGTIAQGDVGLYRSQNTYFSSWLLWLGSVPTPGGRLVLSVTGLNLLAMLFTRHGTRSTGLFLLHAGTLLLLGGSLVSSAFRHESQLQLFDRDSSSELQSKMHHELAVRITGQQDDLEIAWRDTELTKNAVLSRPELPFSMTVVRHLRNCKGDSANGIEQIPSEKEVEQNQAGIELLLPQGKHIFLREFGPPVAIDANHQIELRRTITYLPFVIELIKVSRVYYPGTTRPREFSSEILVHEGATMRRVVISMNRPLRIGDWTIYQANYGETERGPYSGLAVVRDSFQFSPYVSSSIMLVGLLLHIGSRLRPRRKESA